MVESMFSEVASGRRRFIWLRDESIYERADMGEPVAFEIDLREAEQIRRWISDGRLVVSASSPILPLQERIGSGRDRRIVHCGRWVQGLNIVISD